jgi:hypothetical protein
VPDPSKLDWNARNALAEKFATIPGGPTGSRSDIVNACSRKLSA